VRVSVLDQSPIPEGSTPAQALHNSLDLAQLTDRLGYHRYWLAEHHSSRAQGGAAPEVLISAIASITSGIRVGSGGVMLPHYSPFKVAEVFCELAGLFPGRIDLGIGRAAGTDGLTTFALQRDRREASPDDFPSQLAELFAYLDGSLPPDHPFARLSETLPGLPEKPERWLLGSSPQSAIWAAQLGCPYAFSDFINAGGAVIAADYRRRYAEARQDRPSRTSVGIFVICAETDEEAQYAAASIRMAGHLRGTGERPAVPRPETAVDFLRSIGDDSNGDSIGRNRRALLGTPEKIRDQLLVLTDEYGADELILITNAWDHQVRRRSYELLAEALEIEPRVAASGSEGGDGSLDEAAGYVLSDSADG
jgi:luciferase family oxidoreductase group 1